MIQEEVSAVEARQVKDLILRIRREISRIFVGQEGIINALIRGVLCNGHILLEGVPGIAKTLAVRALGAASGCNVKRVQFTVDLLPTDIIGLTTYIPNKGFEVIKGPIFSNFLIADEINRSPPKVQSALLEAMQERIVTIGKENYPLSAPFFVMATQNPLEVSGVYFLPEAELDRFLFKLNVTYPSIEDEIKILKTNINLRDFEEFNIKAVTSPKEIVAMQDIVKKIYVAPEVEKYIVRIVHMTRKKEGFEHAKFVEWGGSPRASIGIYIAAKAEALMQGRKFVTPDDVKKIAFDVLRHRIILTYAAQVEGINSDFIIKEILNKVPVP
ncbi:MoxR family ATPase [Candidatus Pacearchaeota archaeon]|nr:MoxR family ATPase [Candidatus Pacearchaeota archaeon]